MYKLGKYYIFKKIFISMKKVYINKYIYIHMSIINTPFFPITFFDFYWTTTNVRSWNKTFYIEKALNPTFQTNQIEKITQLLSKSTIFHACVYMPKYKWIIYFYRSILWSLANSPPNSQMIQIRNNRGSCAFRDFWLHELWWTKNIAWTPRTTCDRILLFPNYPRTNENRLRARYVSELIKWPLRGGEWSVFNVFVGYVHTYTMCIYICTCRRYDTKYRAKSDEKKISRLVHQRRSNLRY